MATICADELLREASPARPVAVPAAKPATTPRPAAALAAPVERPRPLRYEDFEQRTSTLGDLLGGQVFPRTF